MNEITSPDSSSYSSSPSNSQSASLINVRIPGRLSLWLLVRFRLLILHHYLHCTIFKENTHILLILDHLGGDMMNKIPQNQWRSVVFFIKLHLVIPFTLEDHIESTPCLSVSSWFSKHVKTNNNSQELHLNVHRHIYSDLYLVPHLKKDREMSSPTFTKLFAPKGRAESRVTLNGTWTCVFASS